MNDASICQLIGGLVVCIPMREMVDKCITNENVGFPNYSDPGL